MICRQMASDFHAVRKLCIKLSGEDGDLGGHLNEVPCVMRLVLVRPCGKAGLPLLDGQN